MELKTFNEKYISNYITENEVRTWRNKRVEYVVISSPTGTGKNFFINNVLLKHVMEYDRSMLILSNRVGLNYQEKLELLYKLIEYTGDEDVIQRFDAYDPTKTNYFVKLAPNLHCCSYQHLVSSNLLLDNHYDFIILDECQFFLADSPFNSRTGQILNHIIDNTKLTTKILLSATIEDAFNLMAEVDDEFLSDTNLLYYNKYVNRNIVSVKDVRSITELEQIISPKDKWVMFVSDSSVGKCVRDQLNSKNINSVFISRDEINSDPAIRLKYNTLLYNQNTDNVADVLISTSVLDNGINLYFNGSVNVFIDSVDKTQFIQMLGRIRGNSNINLFYRNYSEIEAIGEVRRLLHIIFEVLYRTNLTDIKKEIEFDGRYNYLSKGVVYTNLLIIIYCINRINEINDFYKIDITKLICEFKKLNPFIFYKCKHTYTHSYILSPFTNLIQSFFNREVYQNYFRMIILPDYNNVTSSIQYSWIHDMIKQ